MNKRKLLSGTGKLTLASAACLVAAAPAMDSGSELIAALGLVTGLVGVVGLALVAWRQL